MSTFRERLGELRTAALPYILEHISALTPDEQERVHISDSSDLNKVAIDYFELAVVSIQKHDRDHPPESDDLQDQAIHRDYLIDLLYKVDIPRTLGAQIVDEVIAKGSGENA